MDSNSVASCWSSYSQYDGPLSEDLGHSFLLSVVLDADTWKLFSSFRIILICHNYTEALRSLVSICNRAPTSSIVYIYALVFEL